jgi:hypothetical protein
MTEYIEACTDLASGFFEKSVKVSGSQVVICAYEPKFVVSIAEYANYNGISISAVNDRIALNKIECVKNKDGESLIVF